MSDEHLKLTVYFGERDRVGAQSVADALAGIYAAHRVKASVLLRGIEGFGADRLLRTDRRLTPSEDLPLMAIAVDTAPRIQAVLADAGALRFGGLVTLERAQLLTGELDDHDVSATAAGEAVKLTVYLGRHERVPGSGVRGVPGSRGRPGAGLAYKAVVGLLRSRGIAGATVLLGVDGTVHGARRRARFFASNAEVPLMVIAVGDRQGIADALPALGELLAQPLMTLERVRVCKRDGVALADPHDLPETDPAGLGIWQLLTVYTGEQSRIDGRPINHHLLAGLRQAGASGATSMRGIWGYHGDHDPHGDSLWQLRRRVPVLTAVVDTPQRSRQWFSLIDGLTRHTGLVTSEMVPAFRATGSELTRGGLRIANLDSLR